MLRSIFIPLACLFCVVLPSTVLKAEITPRNAYNYLEMGEMTYTIEVRPENVDWIEDLAAIEHRIQELKSELERNPQNLDAAFELLSLYRKQGRDSDAESLAKERFPAFKERYNLSKDEKSAVRYAEAALAAIIREEYDPAYLALLPFLESGRADRLTCITAVKNRNAREDYTLARRVADVYIEIYPDFADLYYQRYLLSLTRNLRQVVFDIMQTTSEQFLKQRGELAIDSSNVEEFITYYLENLEARIDNDSLLKAVELEPANYKYNLSAATFKTITHFFSKGLIPLLAKDVDGKDIEKILLQVSSKESAMILTFLQRAQKSRPKRDIQVYLAYALYSFAFGQFDKIQPYASLAVETRPDLAEGYNALIFITFLPILASGQYSLLDVNRRAVELIERKLENTGDNPYDYFVLAGLRFSNYGEVDESQKQSVLRKMKQSIDRSLEIDPQYTPSLIGLANYHILKEEYPKAIAVLQKIENVEDTKNRALVHNNLGISRILNGERQAGVSDLKEALDLLEDNQKTLDALKELGID
jgi:hypothetical protein